MRYLYWACEEQWIAGLLEVTALRGRAAKVVGRGNGWPVVEVQDPDLRLLRETARLILQRRLISAALVKEPLSQDEFSIAAEWRQRLVVGRSERDFVEKMGDMLRHENDVPSHDLAIFQVVESADVEELGPLDAREFSAEAVQQDPIAYYGKTLGDPRFGGASALFAAGREAARVRGLPKDRVLVGEPKVFGFSVDDGHSSVVAWGRKRVIAASAFGFSLDNWEVVAKVEGFGPDQVNQDKLAGQVGQWKERGIWFGLAVLLRGLKDPPVVIPMGSVYQQPAIHSRDQNLAVAQATQVAVGVGASVPLVLPAWCLNPSFSPPNGPMNPTPLVALAVNGSQSAVWDSIKRRYRGQP